jgi:hypothetical protein
MQSDKVNELRKEIKYIEADIAFKQSLIALLMEEANMLDHQASMHAQTISQSWAKIRDLKAELKDTE